MVPQSSISVTEYVDKHLQRISDITVAFHIVSVIFYS